MNSDSGSDRKGALSPEDVVRTVFALVDVGRFDEVAAYVDADDLKRMRREAEAAAGAPEPAPMTADDYMRRDPQLPRAVAEYYARDDRRPASRAAAFLARNFAGVTDATDLEALDTAQLLARRIEAGDPRSMLRQAAAAGVSLPAEAADFPAVRRVVLGAVREGEDTAHVLFRAGFESSLLDAPEIASLRRTAEGWRMRYRDHDFLGSLAWGISLESDPELDPDEE